MLKLFRALSIILILFFISCGKSGNDQPANNDEGENKTGIKSVDKFVENMKEVQKSMEEGQKYEVVDFRELKELLPESIGNLNRTNAEGEKSGAMGFTVSRAQGNYNNEDYSESIDIEIVDLAGASGFAGLAAWGWAMADIDKETETGYEKTTTYKGHKAYEKYNTQDMYGSFEVLVSGRYMVSVNGSSMQMDDIKAALDEMDISKLESMSKANPVSE